MNEVSCYLAELPDDASGQDGQHARSWMALMATAKGRDLVLLLVVVLTIATFVTIAILVVAQAGKVTGDTAVGLVAALVPGVISVVVSVFAYVERKDATSERESIRNSEKQERADVRTQDLVLRSLDFFTGKTQRRNVGVSVVEGAWDSAPRLRQIFVPLLVNQAVYLLEGSDQRDAAHEKENLRRIMDLLLKSVTTESIDASTYSPVTASLSRRLAGRVEKGVDVSAEQLNEWEAAFRRAGILPTTSPPESGHGNP